jgi:hypothetical protein
VVLTNREAHLILLKLLTTPTAPLRNGTFFINGAASPPYERRGMSLDSDSFTPSIDRTHNSNLRFAKVSLKRRGGCGINQISRSHRIAADGVVRSPKAFRPHDFAGLTTIYASRYRARGSRPFARTKVASRYFWPAHPPLLFKEGNMLARQFIPHLHRSHLQFKSSFCKGLLFKEGNVAPDNRMLSTRPCVQIPVEVTPK